MQMQQPTEAAPAFQRALGLSPDDGELALALGSAHALCGALDEALKAFEMACARDGRSAQAHLSRGQALRDLGREAEAREAFSTALALDPLLDEARREHQR